MVRLEGNYASTYDTHGNQIADINVHKATSLALNSDGGRIAVLRLDGNYANTYDTQGKGISEFSAFKAKGIAICARPVASPADTAEMAARPAASEKPKDRSQAVETQKTGSQDGARTRRAEARRPTRKKRIQTPEDAVASSPRSE
ncbi:MAG: hypothetical protein IH986_10140 [Planctomycetes bacterium]|nr:hypothetical protein [Planctomycetota bacterium]